MTETFLDSPSYKKRNVEGKVVIVTGSTQGVGEGIARLLAELDAAGLVICGRNRERGEAVAADLTSAGCTTVYVQADLENVDDCRQIVAACDAQFGRVDGLVNAAGITDRGTIDDTSVELWDRMFAVNTRAPFILMQESVRIMKREGKGGSIVNILSMSAHGGQPFITAYCASKGALATLTKNAAHALRFDRIRVNGVNMGWTYTPNEHKTQLAMGKPENWLDEADASKPFGRILRPRDIAGITAYLLSDESQMMTGSLIDFDQYVVGNYDT
jgi:NAD(P)-dependent dehydrogenase (short-subunit alcohol dehydrogenase family)